MQIDIRNWQGETTGKAELMDSIFAVPHNATLLHQVFVSLQNNARIYTAHTKTRGEVSGSGKKPWAQKGTGRARHGEIRSPLWRGGGITFGPRKDRNYSQRVNKLMRQKAVIVALSDKIRSGHLILLDSLNLPEIKTKFAAKGLTTIGVDRSVTVAVAKDAEREVLRAMQNIPRVNPIMVENMSVVDLLNTKYLVVSQAGIEVLVKRFIDWQS